MAGRIISKSISRADLRSMAEAQFGDWIKAVVDVSRGIMGVGGDLHADDEALLLERGSRQQDLWGNRSRGVDDASARERIRAHEAGPSNRFEGALARALELFDLTAADPRWHGHRCQEVLRARHEFCRLFFDPDVPPGSADGLRRYFFGFAYAARMRHYRDG